MSTDGAARGALLRLGERVLDTLHGPFRAHVFLNLRTRSVALALGRGELGSPDPILCRAHSSCLTSESLGACDCDCAEQLSGALEQIAAEGRGVVFYLMQEGRGAGLAAKASDRMLVQASRHRLTTFEAYDALGLPADSRRYDEVAAACALLGIRAPLEVLTNNPGKVEALEREKLRVAGTRPLEHRSSPFNAHYLHAKRRSGHALRGSSGVVRFAEPPEPVARIEPAPLPAAPHLLYVASYLLPVLPERIAAAGPRETSDAAPQWLRLHLYLDRRARREVLVLRHGRRAGRRLPVRVQHEALFERFPLRRAPSRERWAASLRRFARAGAGLAVFVPATPSAQPFAAPEGVEDTVACLLSHHLGGTRPELLLDGAGSALEARVRRAAERSGVAWAGTRSLDPGEEPDA